jgi:chromosome segregation ATPase
MTMTQTTTFTGNAEERLVTVADLRRELHNERRITDSRFGEVVNRIETVDYRVTLLDQKVDDFKTETLRRFDQVDKRFEQVDKRFEQVDKRFEQIDKRFEQVDKRFDRIDARFDALDERLRSNKTLLILSASTTSSIASVVISLLK